MALKTQPSKKSVDEFIKAIPDDTKRNDCLTLTAMMQEITGEPPVMWGPSIVGFGTYHYIYESGTEGDWMLTGYSPRKQNLSIYLMDGCAEHCDHLDKLGKHKTSVSCLYIKKLSDVDLDVLKEIITMSTEKIRSKYS
jgi:hypothetical protein